MNQYNNVLGICNSNMVKDFGNDLVVPEVCETFGNTTKEAAIPQIPRSVFEKYYS